MGITVLTLPEAHYRTRETIGGGTARDVMPWEGATAYITDGERYGIQFEDGHVDWLADSLHRAFGLDDEEIDWVLAHNEW